MILQRRWNRTAPVHTVDHFVPDLEMEKILNIFINTFLFRFAGDLKELSIDQVDENAAIESYRDLRSKIDEINLCITELLELRKAIEPVCSWSEAEQRKEQLVNRRDELSAQKREIEQQITERQQAEDTLQKQMQELTGDLSELQKEQKDIDARLNALYTEQKEFEDTSKLKRFFKFLFPETAALLKKYVSSEQIRDFIQDERTLRASNYAQMKRVESQLKQKAPSALEYKTKFLSKRKRLTFVLRRVKISLKNSKCS